MTRFYNPLTAQKYFKLTYLDEDSDYLECHTQEIYGGDELRHMGLCVPLEHGDFKTYTFILKKYKWLEKTIFILCYSIQLMRFTRYKYNQ